MAIAPPKVGRRKQRDNRKSACKRGYDRKWQALRKIVLSNESLCRSCKAKGWTVVATDVDHIIPKRAGGSNDMSNLQPLCKSCHSAKTASGL